MLGSVAVLSVALTMTSSLLALFAPHFGWNYSSKSPYTRLQIFLNISSSILLLGPAVVNIVLTLLWRRSPDHDQSLQGRCHWDIDVAWSGTGFQCDATKAIAYGYWLGGAIARLVVTVLILVSLHCTA